jgi:predicted RNA-binding Zn ribbon-like protein
MPDPPDPVVAVPDPYVFDLDGGRPCLDFANTLSFSGADHLNSYADLLAFASQSHLVTLETTASLDAAARRQPSAALATLERAKQLRQALRGLFTALANQTPPLARDVDVLNANLAKALPHTRLVLDDALHDAYSLGWATNTDLSAPLWPIVRSAADLLTSNHERSLVRECGADDCAWLFLDSTRNRSRQWCSMTSCGNREKARRHYQRVKAARTPSRS